MLTLAKLTLLLCLHRSLIQYPPAVNGEKTHCISDKEDKRSKEKTKDRKCRSTMKRSAGLWMLETDDAREDSENDGDNKLYEEINVRHSEETGIK